MKINGFYDRYKTIPMGIIKSVVRALAVRVHDQIEFMGNHPHKFQQAIFQDIVNKGKQTKFGKEHEFKSIKSYEDFKNNVAIQEYKDYKHYIDEIIDGGVDVLWPGKPKYILETNSPSSEKRFLPISKDSLPYHFNTARNAIFNYTLKYGLLPMFDGKFLYLADNSKLTKKGKYQSGNLGSIVNKEIPRWLKFNQLPSAKTNSIEDWDQRMNKIVDETINEDLTMISGIPTWTIEYLNRILTQSKMKSVKDVFPEMSVFVHGGMDVSPYLDDINTLMGKKVDTIETYSKGEGFIAFQDLNGEAGLLLNVNGGLFFEFIPKDQINSSHPERIQLQDVELNKEYEIVTTTNAGLYASRLGDIIEFVSMAPYRIVFKSRTHQNPIYQGEKKSENEELILS